MTIEAWRSALDGAAPQARGARREFACGGGVPWSGHPRLLTAVRAHPGRWFSAE